MAATNPTEKIEFSQGIRNERWFANFGCEATTHSIIILIGVLRNLVCGCTKYIGPFMLFRLTLLQSRLENWQCTDPACLFYNIKQMKKFSVTAKYLWDAAPEEFLSKFKEGSRNLRLRLQPTEITPSKVFLQQGITFFG